MPDQSFLDRLEAIINKGDHFHAELATILKAVLAGAAEVTPAPAPKPSRTRAAKAAK